jgi:hypothetical protein
MKKILFFLGLTLFFISISSLAMAAPAQHLQITETEFRLSLSRTTLHPGVVDIEVLDFGADDHDLLIRRVGSKKIIHFSLLHAGDKTMTPIYLGKGKYQLWCGIANHAKLGMIAHLIVK